MTDRLVRLKTRADFLRVAAGRARAARPGLVLQAAAQPEAVAPSTGLRVGFTASRRVGNAVARNRAKRRLRAAAAAILPLQGKAATDYVLIARGRHWAPGPMPSCSPISKGRCASSANRRPEER